MGGKKQRTKGNVQPSSSGRAAELLARESGTVPGFIGFGASQNDLGYVPAVQGSEDIDSLVDADFRMVLRKLSKRDVITKLKAVQEFGAMCKEREMENVKGVLPYWPRNYCKISLDNDRRVREATQLAFHQLILKVKKNLAPYLKNIMGYWLIAQCDTYSPAASAAVTAFEVAFPSNKQSEALAFCKEEIVSVLQDHLLRETPDTLSDPQTVPEEEREAKYLRVVTSSLLALKKLLCMLPMNENNSLEEKLKYLLSQNKFWKYSKHNIPQIRSAFFEVISTFCQHLCGPVKVEAQRTCAAVLLNIDEKDAVVCPAQWEAVLCVVTTIEDCWSHVNVKKGVLPKLWTMLREGGRGLAGIVYPNLLPFISKVPQGIMEPKLDFFSTFFSAIILGLSSERAVSSSSECSAIISGFMECLRYAVLQNLGEEEQEIKVQKMLINDQLMPLIDSTLKNPQLQKSPLFYQIADTLSSWEKRTMHLNDEENAHTFKRILSEFWDSLSQICGVHVDASGASETTLVGVSRILQILKEPEGSEKMCKRKSTKIRFTDEEGSTSNIVSMKPVYLTVQSEDTSESDNIDSVPSAMKSQTTSEPTPLYLSCIRREPLEALVCKLAEQSMVHISEEKSERHLRFLASLLSSFPYGKVFEVLLTPECPGNLVHPKPHLEVNFINENPAVQFLYQKLTVWLKEDCQRDPVFLVDILFSILQCCCSNAERRHILDDLTRMDLRWSIFLQIIQKACSDSERYSSISFWLKGDTLGTKLVKLADILCHSGLEMTTSSESCSERWTLLSLVLSQHVENESLIGDVYVEKIINRLHIALSKAKDLSETGSIEQSVSFICNVASNFFNSVKRCLLMPSAEDLLLTVFQLCAQSQDKTRLSDIVLHKLNHTWQTGLNSLLHQFINVHEESTFLPCSALWVKNQLLSSSLDVKNLQVLISAVSDLLCKILEAGQPSYHLLLVYMDYINPDKQEWQNMRQALPIQWLNKPLLEGRLSLNSEVSGTDLKLYSSARLTNHFCASSLLSKMALLVMETQELLTITEDEQRKINSIFAELLYSMQWCEELEDSAAISRKCCELFLTMGITRERLWKCGEKVATFLDELYYRSRESGMLWSLAAAKMSQTRNSESFALKRLFQNTEGFFPLTDGSLHTIQSLIPFFADEEKEEIVIQCTARLMTCSKVEVLNIDGGFGYLAAVNSCLRNGYTDCEEILPGILKIIMSWKADHEDLFLFSCNLKDASLQVIALNIEIIRHLSLLINLSSCPLADNEWDFIMCSILAWLETVNENTLLYKVPLIQLFACESFNLASALNVYFQDIAPSTIEKLPRNLLSEWKEFFSEGINSLLLPLLVKIAGESKDPSSNLSNATVLKFVSDAVTYISKDQLLNHMLPPKFVANQKTNLPDKLQTLLNTFAPFLLYRSRPVQIAVYHILNKLMPELPKFDAENLKSYGDEEEEPVLSPPAALMSSLITQEDLLTNILADIPVGELAVVQPLSEEFCYILGYLLTWKLILSFFKAASSQLRVLYSQYLRKCKSLNKLLYHLFRLMPENPTFPGQIVESSNKETKTFFTEELNATIQETAMLSSEIAHLACSVYYTTLKDLPAMVRLWWNGCEKRIFNVVDKFTSKYVSSVLSSQEIASVQTSTQSFDGMTVKARSAAREVIATYSVDDIFIELIIQLPPNYPLGSIAVESGKRVGVAVQQWRNWTLQLSTYLTHQNGSIMEGLALWKNNVDKRFEGVEDCMICFSVIHGSNYSLPKKACRTCKKKFHSACLYKWFTSSNKSTCPLCRETFF
ncbi:E3 ubiquitin-protein ligase listerin [Microcaecilia unicolor]|uniref:E3 ubiquitin-protein ligase listerin n=1 Tax=Microcaecilia unicolor TaxID=1415580 RepID=A0A6P7YBC8_9AMPH|nr:E3 ubiquitin-protein ligase listerin [Microcaecilia unicolor]